MFKNKILIISILFVLVIFCSNLSFAFSKDNEFIVNENITIIDDCFTYPYVSVFANPLSNQLFVYYSDLEFSFVCGSSSYMNGNTSLNLKCYLNDGVIVNNKTFKLSSDSYELSSENVLTSSSFGLGIAAKGDVRDTLVDTFILYSDIDILDEEGNLVFQAPPQVIQEKTLEEVAKETLEKKEIQAVLLEVLKKIVVTIVGLIGFWKAYCFLLKQLRSS